MAVAPHNLHHSCQTNLPGHRNMKPPNAAISRPVGVSQGYRTIETIRTSNRNAKYDNALQCEIEIIIVLIIWLFTLNLRKGDGGTCAGKKTSPVPTLTVVRRTKPN